MKTTILKKLRQIQYLEQNNSLATVPEISIEMKAKYLFETIFKTKKDCGNPQKERLREPLKRKTAGTPQTMRKYY
jgi:hypothetical protein